MTIREEEDFAVFFVFGADLEGFVESLLSFEAACRCCFREVSEVADDVSSLLPNPPRIGSILSTVDASHCEFDSSIRQLVDRWKDGGYSIGVVIAALLTFWLIVVVEGETVVATDEMEDDIAAAFRKRADLPMVEHQLHICRRKEVRFCVGETICNLHRRSIPRGTSCSDY